MTSVDPAPRRLHFELPGEMQGLMERVRGIESFLLDAGCSVGSSRQFAMVAEEILANILRDAWPDRSSGFCVVDVTLEARSDAIHVTLRTEDDGIDFDPTQAAVPDLEASLDDRPVGGLGIFLVRSMTDTQRYRRTGERNVFEVSKAYPLR